MRAFGFLLLLLGTSVVFANEVAHGDHELIPVKTIIYQTINVSIILVGLIYFLKKPARDFFKEKKDLFLTAAAKAQSVRALAEQEHVEIQVRLTKLESTADESISRARAEAADMKKQLIEEANVLSKRIKSEAESAARLEVERAKNRLREEIIAEATKMARTQLASKVSGDDHKRLQTDFIDSIKAVQP